MPWDMESGLNRLKHLEALERYDPPPAPHGYHVPENQTQVLEMQREYVLWEMAPELVDDRMRIYHENLQRLHVRPPWMTLLPATDLRNWAPILQVQLQVEPFAVDALKEVIATPHFGTYEANRIIAHMLKDSDSSSRDPLARSKWLNKTCNESLSAMREWLDWDCEAMRRLGMAWKRGDLNKWYWVDASTLAWDPQSSGGSSSSRFQGRR